MISLAALMKSQSGQEYLPQDHKSGLGTGLPGQSVDELHFVFVEVPAFSFVFFLLKPRVVVGHLYIGGRSRRTFLSKNLVC
jgi:hypothetical protein